MVVRWPRLALTLVAGVAWAACSNGPDFDLPGRHDGRERSLAIGIDPTTGSGPIIDEDAGTPNAANTVGIKPIARGKSTLPIAFAGWPISLDGIANLDAVVRRTANQEHAVVALRAKERVRFLELAAGKDGRATIVAQREFEAVTPGPIGLAEREGTLIATWVDAGELHVATSASDVGAMRTETILGEPAAPVVGNAAVLAVGATASHDAGFLVCAATDPGGPRCAVLTNVTSGNIAAADHDGWAAIGKLGGHAVETILPAPHGYFVVTSNCTSRGGCARRAVAVTRLDQNLQAPKKKATRHVAEIQSRRGVTAIPTTGGMLLVARRVGAGETAAWHVSEDEVREDEGRFTKVLGGFFADGTTVVVEAGLLVMRDGFPVAPPRPRRWTETEGLRDYELWPSELDAMFPTDVDQAITSAPGVVVFATPARKGHTDALILMLNRS